MDPTPDPLKNTLETILVVDNDPSIVRLIGTILERANFRVLTAYSAAEALTLSGEPNQTIDLLLAEVGLSQMSGPNLASAVKKIRPDIRMMFMSASNHGLLVLNYGWAYLQKPFLAEILVRMVTRVLHSEDRSQGSDGFDTRSVPDQLNHT